MYLICQYQINLNQPSNKKFPKNILSKNILDLLPEVYFFNIFFQNHNLLNKAILNANLFIFNMCLNVV